MRWPDLRKSWSIVGFLTLLFTVSSLILLCAAGGFLYWDLKKNLDAQSRSTLADKIAVLRDIVRERPDDIEALQEEIEWESASRRNAVYYGRLLTATGQVIVESPGFSKAISNSAVFPPPAKEDQGTGTMVRHREANNVFMLTTAWARKGLSGKEQNLYQVALDISPEQKILANYREKLFLVVLVGVLFSAGSSLVIALQGIRPINQITRAAHRITASALNERVGAKVWPVELAGLALEFDQMLQRLEDAFSRLSQFSADIAHELRTPINNMMGEAELGLSRERSKTEYRQVLVSSLEENHRLSRLIDRLLFLARADNAKLACERTWFKAQDVLHPICESHEPLASENNVTLTVQGEAPVFADLALFRRAIANLVSNALKHTPPGGRVTITSDHHSQATWIRVRDTGPGIAPEHLPKLFDRFYRADPARTTPTEGAGLGLAIVKSIMELHRGSATITSEPGRGTEAVLRFPS